MDFGWRFGSGREGRRNAFAIRGAIRDFHLYARPVEKGSEANTNANDKSRWPSTDGPRGEVASPDFWYLQGAYTSEHARYVHGAQRSWGAHRLQPLRARLRDEAARRLGLPGVDGPATKVLQAVGAVYLELGAGRIYGIAPQNVEVVEFWSLDKNRAQVAKNGFKDKVVFVGSHWKTILLQAREKVLRGRP